MIEQPKYRKVYVDVFALMRQDGTLLPRGFVWEDGEKYRIDRVRHATPAASTKVGGRGMRYTVVVGGQEQYLYREEDDRWFMEAPMYQ